MTDSVIKVGRCQHCQQVRPVFHYDRTHDNGEPIWDAPYPPYQSTTGAWLCVRDWDGAEAARVNGRSFRVAHDLEVWPWQEAKPRLFAGGGEVQLEGERDLEICQAILAASSPAREA